MKNLLKSLFLTAMFLSTNIYAANDLDGFIAACVRSAGLDVEICRCIAERADSELSPGGFQFVVANLAKDKQTIEALRWRLKDPELNETTRFMVHAPKQCAETIETIDRENNLVQ